MELQAKRLKLVHDLALGMNQAIAAQCKSCYCRATLSAWRDKYRETLAANQIRSSDFTILGKIGFVYHGLLDECCDFCSESSPRDEEKIGSGRIAHPRVIEELVRKIEGGLCLGCFLNVACNPKAGDDLHYAQKCKKQ